MNAVMPAEFLSSFRDSMPPSYVERQSADDIREHALIAWRRGNDPVHAEIWTRRRNAVVICIVADERAGLASLIRATVAAHGLDVLAAQNYARNNEKGHPEAIHLLWVNPGPEISPRSGGGDDDEVGEILVSSISIALSELLRGETDLGAVIQRASSPPAARSGTDVTVSDTHDDDESLLFTVDTDDRPELLARITSILLSKSVSIDTSEANAVGGRARCRFRVLELDGAPLSLERAREIASAIRRGLSE